MIGMDALSLMNYGVLGLWTLTLLYDKYVFMKSISQVIDKNNELMIKTNQCMEELKDLIRFGYQKGMFNAKKD